MSARFPGGPPTNRPPNRASRMLQARFNQALQLQQAGRLREAQAIYQEILKVQPRHFDSLHLNGLVEILTGNLVGGIKLIDKAIKVNPNVAPAYNNRGNALLDLGRAQEALASYNKALSLKSDYPSAHNNRGNALLALERLEEALASYDKALSLTPNYPDACFNRGNVLSRLKRFDEALASYGKALSLRPNYPEAYNNRGNLLQKLGRLNEALADFEKALSLQPDFEFLLGTYLNTRMTFCDWRSFAEDLKRYEEGISAGRKVTIPFPSLCLLDAPALHRKAAEIFIKAQHPRSQALGVVRKRKPDGKIRVGYYSADFREHAMTYLMAGLYEAHDADRFEIYGLSIGPYKDDRMRQRVSSAFHKFIDVRDRSDRQIAQLSRELGIDIAVDLNGHTQGARPGMFAEGCAPVQVNYLGYPGTVGADYIDYIMADKTVLPVENQPHFSEKAVYLPHCYQVNDPTLSISDRRFTRQELGLPDPGFVFCCFNNGFKILPATFDGWMRILKAVEGSVLWLLESNQTAVKNLRKEAEVRGVDGSRLVFAKRMPLEEHLARYRLADLFIDTLPYNAHTTTSDALRVGVPVLTCMGHAFAARVAASLLNTVGLPEMITSSQEDFEAKAIELARSLEKLRALKTKLESNRATTPLFDSRLSARHIEAAYEAMYARCQAGMPPEVIEVQP